jgi:hypothetical protein
MDSRRWKLHFALYGAPDVVDVQYAIVHRALSRVPGAVLSANRYVGDARPTGRGDRNLAGIPAMSAFRMLDWRGGGPIIAEGKDPRDHEVLVEVAQPVGLDAAEASGLPRSGDYTQEVHAEKQKRPGDGHPFDVGDHL